MSNRKQPIFIYRLKKKKAKSFDLAFLPIQ